jgi:hypothetical protein
MTEKTYWGLNELELNKMWKLTDKYKNAFNIFLSIDKLNLQEQDTYDYYYEKIINKYPDFTIDMLYAVDDDMEDFKDKDKTYNDYYDYKKNKLIVSTP